MTRSMQDFVDARTESLGTNVWVDVPVVLPGYGAIGKYGSEPDQPVGGLMVALATLVLQPYRMITRTVKKVASPNSSVYQRAQHRNYEVAITDDEVLFCPASPLLLRTYEPENRLALDTTSIHFESVQVKMSKLTIGGDVWHVHPEYVGDVRWALRKLKQDYPGYDITFSGGEIVEPAETSADYEEVASDEEE